MRLRNTYRLTTILCLTVACLLPAQALSAVRQDQDDAQGAYNKGIAYFISGAYEEAAAAFEKVIRLDPSKTEVYRKLGYSYDKLGQYEKAIEAYKQVVVLDPGNVQAYRAIGKFYAHLDQYKEAADSYYQALSLDPTDETRTALAELPKLELYSHFRKNFKTDQRAAYEAATEYLQKYGNDEQKNQDKTVLAFMRQWVAAYERYINSPKP